LKLEGVMRSAIVLATFLLAGCTNQPAQPVPPPTIIKAVRILVENESYFGPIEVFRFIDREERVPKVCYIVTGGNNQKSISCTALY
jgi:hypothetical protein